MTKRRRAQLRPLLARLKELGWDRTIVAKRCGALGEVQTLAGAGLVSSCSISPGQEIWRLNLTRFGREVRAALIAEGVTA